jgi:hypothetical protein
MYEMLLDPSEGFTFVAGKRNYLLFVQQNAATHAEPILCELQKNGLPYEWYELHDEFDRQALTELLSRQKMGAYLYAAGSYQTVRQWKKLAEHIGFGADEMQVMALGPRQINLFCAGCQNIFQTGQREHVCCPSCGLVLTITPHYSRRLDAYLGYAEIR